MKRCRKCCHWLMDFNHQSRGSRTIDCFKIKEQQHSENYRAFLELQWNASCKDAWNMSVSNQKLLEVYEVRGAAFKNREEQGVGKSVYTSPSPTTPTRFKFVCHLQICTDFFQMVRACLASLHSQITVTLTFSFVIISSNSIINIPHDDDDDDGYSSSLF